ncbi:MAG: monovalent cation/H(+) antiporter subunit G [Alphaproteobacteria bacterium]
MIDFISGIFILLGAAFALIAGIGLFRLPDVYLRMHAATKAGTLGAGLVLLALALDAQQLQVAARAIAGILFLLFTAPIAAHLLGRAGYLSGSPLWTKTRFDELSEKYDADGRRLNGTPPEELRRGSAHRGDKDGASE